jgi:uncharacterized membrane protein YfcA
MISALALSLGCWLQSAVGFGMAVVAAPVIVLVAPEWVPYVLVMTALPLSVINTWHQRAGLRGRDMIVPMVTRIPGTAIGAAILVYLNVMWLQVAVSLSVLLAVLISLRGIGFDATPARLGWAGAVSGFMGTTTSVGGPPMALVMQHGHPLTVRANLSLYFTFSTFISLVGYALAGLLNAKLLLYGLSFLPCALAGFVLGTYSRGYVDAGRFRQLLLWICAAAAIVSLGGAFFNR